MKGLEIILKDLYFGNINPIGRTFVKEGSYNNALNGVIDSQEKLNALLQDEVKNHFDEFCKAQGELSCEESLSSFICGFRLGAKMLIDVFLDNNQCL